MEDKFCYSIKEVSELLNVNYSTLRFWETKFRQIKPIKNKRGVRSYTKQNVEIIQTIFYLTTEKGYTLDGVKKYLDGETKFEAVDKKIQIVKTLQDVKQLLLNIKTGLEKQEQKNKIS
jgi:DNA-binding transcriptional MerR regulator